MSRITDLINEIETKRARSLNLVASENLMSNTALETLRSDLTHRYLIPEDRPEEIWDYPNQVINREIAEITEDLARRLYDGKYADIRPLSGNNVAYIIINSLVPPGGTLFRIPDDCGGHFATPPICQREGIKVIDIPFDRSKQAVDIPELQRLYAVHSPHLIFLDASMVLFPHPTAEIREAVGPRAVISNDCSHVLGLVAGTSFPNPLHEGADIIHGSTHKTLFGPQKGLIVCREEGEVAHKIKKTITPLFVSNAHLHHIAALGVALEELELYGKDYADQVVSNAKTLAIFLDNEGIEVFGKERGYTQSHQIWCVIGNKKDAENAFANLQNININVNLIKIPFTQHYGFRLGLAELTRRGFNRATIMEVGRLIVKCLREEQSPHVLRRMVQAISLEHTEVKYTFEITQGIGPSKASRV